MASETKRSCARPWGVPRSIGMRRGALEQGDHGMQALQGPSSTASAQWVVVEADETGCGGPASYLGALRRRRGKFSEVRLRRGSPETLNGNVCSGWTTRRRRSVLV